ncbi:LOW QUALITY PROTEIN: hypothetical protein CRUP_035484 [Coryphaenoides rupestris]|nr:LOW QUALITY PROTEIN: hypothetical protein CRUP_035484 [Coryphaenoides rupestris]
MAEGVYPLLPLLLLLLLSGSGSCSSSGSSSSSSSSGSSSSSSGGSGGSSAKQHHHQQPHPPQPPQQPQQHQHPTCQEISVPLCRGVGYNHTSMPNQFNHDTQDEAGLEVHQFWPLVEIRCSPDLRFFLCSMYTPICLEDYRKPLPPCRAVCERARAGCAPLMLQYGFPWPDRMRCDLLPVQGDPDTLCMDYNRTGDPSSSSSSGSSGGSSSSSSSSSGGSSSSSSGSSGTTASPVLSKPTHHQQPGRAFNPHHNNNNNNNSRVGRKYKPPCEPVCRCLPPMVPVNTDRHPLYNRVKTGRAANCAMPCHNPYFTQDERTFTAFWIGLWSVLCFISTFATVATFLIDMERFKYPESPSSSSPPCLHGSCPWATSLVAGHEKVACNREYDVEHVHYETTGPALCTVVFLLIYFFGHGLVHLVGHPVAEPGSAAGMKWGQTRPSPATRSTSTSPPGWCPASSPSPCWALSSVDGDSVAGICYVGNQNLDNLRGFVLAPLVIYLFIGTMFLLAGFVSLFRIRSVIKKQGGTKTDKLEKLMIRLGVFTVLYTVPATVIVACYFYEQHGRQSWEVAHNCTSCLSLQQQQQQQQQGGGGAAGRRPDYAVFMLKYFMCLLVGITSGVWIWSGKTLDSWRAFCTRCCWGGKATSGSTYSDVSTGLTTWRSGTASSVSCPKMMQMPPLSQQV